MAFVNMSTSAGQVVSGLMFSNCQWENLQNTAGNRKGIDEAVQRALDIEQRKNLSQKMASTWENTYINIRKRRYEKRRERLLKEQKYKQERYEELRIESEREMKKLRDKAKAALFFERDSCKALHSAFRTSEAEAERLAQLEFNEKLKKMDREIETKYAESILNDVQRYHEEQEEQKRKMLEKKKHLKVEAKEMLQEAEDRKREEKERRRKEEQEDMEIMARQIQQVIENEKTEELRKKAYERNNLLENRELVRQYKEKLRMEEEEENMAVQIIANGKMSIAQIRKQKEQEMLNASRNRHQAMSNKLDNEMEEKRRKEEEAFERAVAEKYKIELDSKEKERQYREMLKKERIGEHLKYMKLEEERLSKEKELLKWEILRRLQREEINNKFTDKLKEQRRQRALDCRNAYKKQIEMDIDKRIKEKEIDLQACQRAQELWELNDKEFLSYAETVREESKKKGRPLYPIDTAIYKYKKSIGLFDKGRNFIWDSKVKRPEGITSMPSCKCEADSSKQQVDWLNSDKLKVIEAKPCGCPKRVNGL